MGKVEDKSDDFTLDERRHWLYCGVTESGKTTLARYHARILARAKWPIIVYDPVRTTTHGGDWPPEATIYTDEKTFLRDIARLKGDAEHPTFVFVDEAPELFNHSATPNFWIARRGRHRGIYLRTIAQRPTMIHPHVRTQHSRLFLFRVAPDDAKEIAADFGHGPKSVADELDTGECFMIKAGSPDIEKFNCFEVVG